MYCQKCRAPLKLHASLEDQLSPAAFDLLVASSTLPTQAKQSLTSSKTPYSNERLETFEKASKTAAAPVFKRSKPAPKYAPANLQEPQGSLGSGSKSRHTSLAKSTYQNPGESFVILTESQLAVPINSVVPPNSNTVVNGNDRVTNGGRYAEGDLGGRNKLSHKIDVSAKLFDILSARSDIDHPICMECTGLLVDGLEKRLANATRERDAYVEFLKKVNLEIPSEEDIRQAEQEYHTIQSEHELALEELQSVEKERAETEEELRQLEEEAKQLDLEEEQFWSERNSFSLSLEEFQNERDGVNLQYDHDSRQLERLQRTNVYNDTFCIGHDGYFGTINGLRLGRLANQPVEWSEINAAWGQTLLLLATVAEKLQFGFEGWRLKPMGSSSRIENIDMQGDTPKVAGSLELFSSGDLPIRLWMYRKFDAAMVAFLDCLKQLGAFVETRDANLKLPYPIIKDKIGDACIRLAFNPDEEWTRACKYTLTCAKFLLAHASNRRATQST